MFEDEAVNEVINRIHKLTPETIPTWGKMKVEEMLAHCNVSYEMIYTNTHKRPNRFVRFMLKTFIKSKVVEGKSYPKNGRTAPQFLITTEKNFNIEKTRLLDFIAKTKSLGEAHFDQKESHSFGKLSKQQWSNSFYYHLDHHLTQFGANNLSST